MSDVIVIGGGINGLVAGACLAKKRYSVLILDRRPTVGGAATTSEIAPGFKAPALSHALGPVHRDVIRAFDLDRAAGLRFITPDPALTALGTGDQHVVFHRDPVLTAASINGLSTRDAAQWQGFLHSAQRIAAVIAATSRHAAPSIDDVGARDLWQLLRVGRRARALGSRDLARLMRWMPMPVADVASEWFEHELVRAAIAARAVFGSIAGPKSAGTGSVFLQRMAEDPMPVGSGLTVQGGPGALADALAAVARRAGAEIVTDRRVARVACENGRATGVVLDDGTEIPSRAVVSAVDPRQTLLELVNPGDLPPEFLERMRHYRSRGVTAKINLALSELPVFPAFHGDPLPLRGRLLVAPSTDYLERAHDAAKYGQISDEPWLEIAMPSIADPSLAPPGCHVMSIYVQAAPRRLRLAVWADQKATLYDRVIRVLDAHAPGFARLVVQREVLSPEDLETHWGVSGGHIFHGEPAIDQSWVARPLMGWAQYRTPVSGLLLASAGTHPGGGLTGMSGLLAGRAVAAALRGKRAISA
jgi:phytoene dehydrogenase-like protein